MAYNSIHTGSTVDTAVTKTTNMPAFGPGVANYASLPGSPSSGDVVLVEAATTGFDAGFYRYSGSAWVYMGNTRQDADDIDDTSTTHRFTTAADISRLSNTSGTNTGDQDLSSYQLKPSEGAFANGDKTKLDGISTGADVTNTSTVTAAGALMDSEVTNLAQVKAFSSSDYATAAQGVKADSAMQDLSDDSSPQLGGNLDVQATEINTSTSNGNIKLNPNGTGCVEAMGDGTTSGTAGAIQLNCSYNTHGIKIQSPAHSDGATYTLTLPTAVGSNNAVLATTSAGVLSFTNNPTLTTPVVTTLDMAGAIQEKTLNSTTITGNTALNAGNGTVQRWVLSGNVNITDSLNEGESVTLVIDDGSGRLIDWDYSSLNIEWVGGSAPTLDTTNETIVVIWKLNSTLYGVSPGVAS
tara:strand:- start:2025 stop:3254 length:1230 start_codon:yes stop_codon:yes gene_type:complete